MRRLVPVFAVLLAFGPAAAHAQAKPEGVLTVAYHTFAKEVLDPGVHSTLGVMYHGHLFDYLIGTAPNGDLAANRGLATSWSMSPDGATWTLKLRPNVKWHDGKPFTADDVVFTLGERYQAKDATCTFCGSIKRIVQEVKAVDPLTVQIKLKKPDITFFAVLSSRDGDLMMLPRHGYRAKGDGFEQLEPPVGTGPWKFAERKVGDSITFDANTGYWDASRAPEFARLRVVLRPEAAAVGVRTYAFPYLFSAEPEDVDAALARTTALIERFDRRSGGRVRVGLGPHGTDTCGPELLRAVRKAADALDCPISIHLAQSPAEVAAAHRRYGKSPLAHADELGILGPDLLAAHCCDATDADLARLGARGVTVVNCPLVYARWGIAAPWARFDAAGVPTALGTDQERDFVEGLRTAGLVSKLHAGRADAATARALIDAATRGGARALRRTDLGIIAPRGAGRPPGRRPGPAAPRARRRPDQEPGLARRGR